MKANQGKPRGAAKPKKRSAARRTFAGIGRFLLTMFLVLVLACTIVGGALAFYVINFITPKTVDISRASLDTTTFLYAADSATGKTSVVAQVSGTEKRTWVPLAQVPEQLQYAFICTEDQRFYEHNGVDWKRTFFSFANLFVHYYSSQQGGSTITQQLVNVRENMGKNKNDYARKLQEIVDALQLERVESKPAILEAYLNTINMNEGYYGVETAAENYFGKTVKQLDLAQCAALACLPKAPSTYDPRKHPDVNADRRKTVLANMLKQAKITQAQYDAAVKEKVTTIPAKTTSVNSWFTEMVITDVQNDLVAKYGWTPDYALQQIYTQGYQIYTTEDPTVQAAMDKVYVDGSASQNYWITYPADYGQPQSAMMIVDYSGNIKGVEGARGKKTTNLAYDRATTSKRQPGSSLKPLGVYAPAIDLNKITWSTPVQLSKITLPNGTLWPMNDGDTNYSGTMLVADALAQSVNTAAVHIDQDFLSPQYTYDFLTKKLGFTSLGKTDIVPSIAIGGMGGVTLREMAGGYEIFGNNGLYIKPHSYTEVKDSQGQDILKVNTVATRAIAADSAYVMNQLLIQNVTRLDGTGHRAAIDGVVVGGKTGTTNDHKDRWFCGITPDYVGVVWVGYDTPKNILYYTTESNPALLAWRSVMSVVDAKPKKASFPYNGDVVKENYDPYTGYITSQGAGVGYYRVTDIYPTAPVPPAAQ